MFIFNFEVFGVADRAVIGADLVFGVTTAVTVKAIEVLQNPGIVAP